MQSSPAPSSVDIMLVFDIDGVITNPHKVEINGQILKRIANELKAGVPVALNTGRPVWWVLEQLIPRLQGLCSAADLGHLILVAEKGGVRVGFEDGSPKVARDSSIALPEGFMKEVSTLLDCKTDDGTPFARYFFIDPEKWTMVTFEKRPEVSIEAFDQVRPKFKTLIQDLLDRHGMQDFRVDETSIATDIEHKLAGKHKGADQVLDWLKERNELVRHFYSLGDSASDEAMAEVFGGIAQSTFVYVGNKPLPHQKSGTHDRIILNGRFDTDTAVFLESLQ